MGDEESALSDHCTLSSGTVENNSQSPSFKVETALEEIGFAASIVVKKRSRGATEKITRIRV